MSSAGCAVVGSQSYPVQETIKDCKSLLLFVLFWLVGLAETVDQPLDDRDLWRRIGRTATLFAVNSRYLNKYCLLAQVSLIEHVAAGELALVPEGHAGATGRIRKVNSTHLSGCIACHLGPPCCGHRYTRSFGAKSILPARPFGALREALFELKLRI